MLTELTPAFQVLGVAIIGDAVSLVLEYYGHSKKTVFVKLISYVACGYIFFDVFWKYIHRVMQMFGVW